MGGRVGKTNGDHFHVRQYPNGADNYGKVSQNVPDCAMRRLVNFGRQIVTIVVVPGAVGVHTGGVCDFPMSCMGLPGESRRQQRRQHQREHCPGDEGIDAGHPLSLPLKRSSPEHSVHLVKRAGAA